MDKRDIQRPLIGRREAGLMMLSGLALAGCGGTPDLAPIPPETVMGEPIRMAAASMDVETAFEPVPGDSNIGYILDKSPAQQLTEWAYSKLVPAGDSGSLEITITRAALTEERLPPPEGGFSIFKDEQNRLVRVEFEAVFRLRNSRGGRRNTARLTVTASYERTISESASVNEADQIRNYVVAEGLARFDQELRGKLKPGG